jgi:hypothetical protein
VFVRTDPAQRKKIAAGLLARRASLYKNTTMLYKYARGCFRGLNRFCSGLRPGRDFLKKICLLLLFIPKRKGRPL